jgi:hypothetical protein
LDLVLVVSSPGASLYLFRFTHCLRLAVSSLSPFGLLVLVEVRLACRRELALCVTFGLGSRQRPLRLLGLEPTLTSIVCTGFDDPLSDRTISETRLRIREQLLFNCHKWHSVDPFFCLSLHLSPYCISFGSHIVCVSPYLHSHRLDYLSWLK